MAEFETAQRLRSLWITFPLKLRALRARLQGLLVRVRTRPVGVIRCVVGKGLQAGVLEDGVVHYPDFAGVVHLDGRGRKAAAQPLLSSRASRSKILTSYSYHVRP